jgi:Flp pilus assembly protein TadG
MTVEAALVIPVILVVLMAVIEVIAAVSTQLELVAAAREGARVAATAPDPSVAVSAARAVLGPSGTAATVSVVRPAVVGRQVRVTVALDKPLVTPLLGGISVPLQARAVMRVER